MEVYIEEVRRLEVHFNGLQIEHVPHAENSIADHLSKCVAQKLRVEPGTFVLHLSQPSVSPGTMARKRRKLDYGKPLLVEPSAPGRNPAGNNSPQPVRPPPPAGPMDPANEAGAPAAEEVPLVLVGSWALVGKVFRQGFYWPTALEDAVELVTECEACQFHAKKTHLPTQAL